LFEITAKGSSNAEVPREAFRLMGVVVGVVASLVDAVPIELPAWVVTISFTIQQIGMIQSE